jgi:hypothetical protein
LRAVAQTQQERASRQAAEIQEAAQNRIEEGFAAANARADAAERRAQEAEHRAASAERILRYLRPAAEVKGSATTQDGGSRAAADSEPDTHRRKHFDSDPPGVYTTQTKTERYFEVKVGSHPWQRHDSRDAAIAAADALREGADGGKSDDPDQIPQPAGSAGSLEEIAASLEVLPDASH